MKMAKEEKIPLKKREAIEIDKNGMNNIIDLQFAQDISILKIENERLEKINSIIVILDKIPN